jgi:hypothetical protein
VNPPVNVAVNDAPAVGGTVQDTPAGPVREHRAPARRAAGKPRRKSGGKAAPAARKLRADYLAEARAAWTPDVEISPAWVRQVTDCSRGMSSQIAADLKATAPAEPDSDALTAVDLTDQMEAA